MVDLAVMGATSPDGIAYLVTGSPINPVSESAQQASTIQAALSRRQLASYYWGSAAERTAQTGARQGDTGYQTDTDQPYWYTGSAFGWIPVLVGHPSYGGGRTISDVILITPTGSGTDYNGYQDITFPQGFFNSPPTVVSTPVSSVPNHVNSTVGMITPAGFRLYLGRTDSAVATTVNWTASQ